MAVIARDVLYFGRMKLTLDMSCQVPSFQKDQKKCCVYRPDRDSHTVISEISQAINFRIVRKFLEVMKIYSLLLRGGLQLSDISENPNNDRIGGDPPTHPSNPNKCLMLDVFMVLQICIYRVYIGCYPQSVLFKE